MMRKYTVSITLDHSVTVLASAVGLNTDKLILYVDAKEVAAFSDWLYFTSEPTDIKA